MILTYHGDNFFRVQNGSFSLVSDPTSDRMKPNIILKTIINPEKISAFSDAGAQIIDSAGEYDISGVEIKGIQIISESTEKFAKFIFLVKNFENFRLCFLGHLSEPLSPEIIDKIGEVDILFLPVGDAPFLSADSAVKIIKQLEPKIIIPAVLADGADKKLAKELGRELSLENKLVLKFKDLPEKGSRLVILKNEIITKPFRSEI